MDISGIDVAVHTLGMRIATLEADNNRLQAENDQLRAALAHVAEASGAAPRDITRIEDFIPEQVVND